MDKKYDWVSGHFTASSSVSKAEFKELLQKAFALLDFDDEASGHTETANGFISWRFFDNGEGAE